MDLFIEGRAILRRYARLRGEVTAKGDALRALLGWRAISPKWTDATAAMQNRTCLGMSCFIFRLRLRLRCR